MKIPASGHFTQVGVARQSAHVNKMNYGRDFLVYQDHQGFRVYSDDHTGPIAGRLIYSTATV